MIYDTGALSNALMFDHAYKILNERLQQGAKVGNMKDAGLIVPVAVNCAFSCELLLKSMLPIGTKGHKLYNDLFLKLDTTLANNIKKIVVQIIEETKKGYSDKDFENDLIANEAAFEQWRYFHEGKTSPSFDLAFMCVFQACLKGIAGSEAKAP
ncbi:MAG: hypothetical protein E7463_11205 [Ruminococcaceae bacterium]|nr:hypothetical protein [Oscillospiraceae bacterium]